MILPKALFQWSQRLPFQHYFGQSIASVFGLAFPRPSRAPPCHQPRPGLHNLGPGSSRRCPRRRQKSQTSDCLGCFRRVCQVPRELPQVSMLGGGGDGTARSPQCSRRRLRTRRPARGRLEGRSPSRTSSMDYMVGRRKSKKVWVGIAYGN